MKLNIAKNLSLPLDAVTETFAILANRGVGKTHTASIMAEEMLKQHQAVVIYDPTGAWWGLKSSKDGKRPGFPVVVFGGEHADVPLEETAGETIASVIVAKRIPAILDVSLLRKNARVRFMTSFCEVLYHRNREPLHFFVDESHTIAPQNLKAAPELARCLGAVEDIVLQGRRRGLGCTLISQRPALVNKNVTTQCQTLIAMRMVGKIDIKVIQEWVEVHADPTAAKEMIANLPTLAKGEAWVWSPAWLDFFDKVKFRDRETFDSSATPKAGTRAVEPKSWAAIDVAALGAEIESTVAKAKADDPAELRKQIAALKKDLAGKQPAQADPAATERAVSAAVKERDRHWQGEVSKLQRAHGGVVKRLAKIAELAHLNGEASVEVAAPPQDSRVIHREAAASPHHRSRPTAAVLTDARPRTKSPATADGGDTSLGKAERLILRAFYWLKDEEATPAKVSFYSGYSSGSSTWNNALGRLRHAHIRGWSITDDGIATVESWGVDPKPSGKVLREWLRGKLGKAENALLDALCENHPHRMSAADLSEASGYSLGSSTWNNAIGKLRSLEAAVGYERDGGTKAADVFFE